VTNTGAQSFILTSVLLWRMGSTWYILDLNFVTIDIESLDSKWLQGLYTSTEEVCDKCCSQEVTVYCMSVSVVNHQSGASYGV